MSSVSQSELSRLLDDEQLGEEAYFLNILSRWDSLRVLDYLFTEGPAPTGKIARDINMDMRDVRDTLNTLAEIGIVEAEEDTAQTVYWKPETSIVHIAITSDDGLKITHTMQSEPPNRDTPTKPTSSVDGVFTKMGRSFDTLLDQFFFS